jgi:hypothetical protein
VGWAEWVGVQGGWVGCAGWVCNVGGQVGWMRLCNLDTFMLEGCHLGSALAGQGPSMLNICSWQTVPCPHGAMCVNADCPTAAFLLLSLLNPPAGGLYQEGPADTAAGAGLSTTRQKEV